MKKSRINKAAMAAGLAVLGLIGTASLATAAPLSDPLSPASATVSGFGENETVTWGAYKAVFRHTGPEGETLEVYDNASDGYAAVAYVRFSTDSDRFVMSTGYHNYNLRMGDSGPYDVPENEWVDIMICRGYASIPGDNCSNWETGWA